MENDFCERNHSDDDSAHPRAQDMRDCKWCISYSSRHVQTPSMPEAS